jgi:hypothetical protein
MLHHNNPQERRKTRVNPKNLLTNMRVKSTKIPIIGEK